jgi:hypothetical protein
MYLFVLIIVRDYIARPFLSRQCGYLVHAGSHIHWYVVVHVDVIWFAKLNLSELASRGDW